MPIFVLFEKVNLSELQSSLTVFDSSSSLLYHPNPESPFEIKGLKEQGLPEPDPETLKKTFHYIKELGHQSIGSKKLIEWLKPADCSFWYPIRFKYWFLLHSFQKQIDTLQQIQNKHKGSKIIVLTNQRFLSKELGKMNIKLTPIIKKKKKKGKKKYLVQFGKIFLRRAFSGLLKHFSFPQKKVNSLILHDLGYTQPILDFNSLKPTRGNPYYGYLLDKSIENESIGVLSEYYPTSLEKGFISLNNPINYKHPRQLHFEFYILKAAINPINLWRIFKFRKQIKRCITEVNTKSPLLGTYLSEKTNMLSYLLLREFATKILFKKVPFKVFTSTHEHDPKYKCFYTLDKKYDKIGVAIQHGVVHPLHMYYTYQKDDLNYNVIPQKTIMWGNHWKQELLQSSIYKENQLVTFGQIRTDIIPKLQKKKKYQTKTVKVLFATQPLYAGFQEIRKNFVKDVFIAAKETPQIRLHLKLHPSETDSSFYDLIANELNFKNYTVENRDLYGLLKESDIVIIYNSTVGAEAVYFEKDLIVLNYNNNDFSGYLKQEIAQEAHTSEKIKLLFSEKLMGKKLVSSIHKSAFISDRAYKIDGGVSDRIIHFLEQLVNKSI